jgi:hypothetical protein
MPVACILQLSGCAAKQSGCQILPVADADQESSSRCSGIGGRAVISNSNSYWSDQVAAPFLWGGAAWPARIYKQELFNLIRRGRLFVTFFIAASVSLAAATQLRSAAGV